jgi:flagellar biosynthesis GTPase FlhF
VSTPGELLGALGREARARLGNGRDAGTRTYRGRSVEELIPRIQRELGADAIIVRRRDGLTGGVLGFFQHAFVEIEAMSGAPSVDVYDEADGAPPPAPATAPPAATLPPAGWPAPVAVPPPAAAPLPPPGVHHPISAYQPLAPMPAPAPVPAPPPPVAPAPPLAPPAPALQEPFYTRTPTQSSVGEGSAYVTAHLAALARAERSSAPPREPPDRRPTAARPAVPMRWSSDFEELIPREQAEPFTPAARPVPPRAPERRIVAPGSHARARAGVAKGLQRFGISEELAAELIDGASAHALALAPRSGLAQAVRSTLAKRIPVAPALPAKGAAIVIVGAGGAGKTTCCAALLGAYRKASSLPSSCATLTRDEERGELRMILSPYVMKPTPASSPRALRALRRARGDGMAVLDTPTLSPADKAGVRELARLLGELSPERVVVALPATLGAAAAAQLLEALRPLGANALAITHADETDQIGVAVEAACRFDLAPEYMLERGRGGVWRLKELDPTGLAGRLLQ